MASIKRIEIDDCLKKFNHAYFSKHQFHLASIKRIQKDDNITRLQFCQSWSSEFRFLSTDHTERGTRPNCHHSREFRHISGPKGYTCCRCIGTGPLCRFVVGGWEEQSPPLQRERESNSPTSQQMKHQTHYD